MIDIDITPKHTFFQSYYGKLEVKYIGEWRKGIAIGYVKDPCSYHDVPCLINKNNEIIYRGYACYDYVEEIYRTSKGYYIVTEYRDFSAPGKDAQFRGPLLKCIISEDGKETIHYTMIKNGHFKNDWYDSDDAEVFTPKEMGLGIVENKNTFYRLSDFTKLFEIPNKFKIESIFEYGFCLLSVPEDNHDYIVTVKDKEIVDFFDVNDIDNLSKLIDKTNNISLVNLATEDSPTLNLLKKQLRLIEYERTAKLCELLSNVYYYSNHTYPISYISKQLISENEFKKGITINSEELNVLQKLHRTLIQHKEGNKKNGRKRAFNFRKNVSSDNDLECFIYSNFIVFKMKVGCYGEKLYRFYSLDGKSLSKKTYNELFYTNHETEIEYEDDFSNNIFHYKNGGKNCGILIIKDGKLIDNRFPTFMYDNERYTYNLTVYDNFISFNDNYYDFFFKPLKVEYIEVKIEEVINRYLYRMTPTFPDVENGDFNSVFEGLYINGSIFLPINQQLEVVYSELKLKEYNRPNHIKEVNYIGEYMDDGKEKYTLYLFKCRPHGYCDAEGRVFYNFKPNEVVLQYDETIF